MRSIELPKNPYVLFFPFLILYIFYVLVFPPDGTIGDGAVYLKYAKQLLSFHFKEPLFDSGSLPFGPGYPIILMPFVLFKLPLVWVTLFNALLYYLSIILIFKSLQQLLIEQRLVVLTSMFWAFYVNSIFLLKGISSEIIAQFLVALLIFSVVKTFNSIEVKKINKYLIITGITLGFIVLTKVIFGYVVCVLLFGSVILWLINKKSANLSRVLMILFISIGLTIPYLTYTYYHTGKIFYWSTNGGNNLYWMSSPYEGEYGSYLSFTDMQQISYFEQNGIYLYNDSNISNHQKVWEEIKDYNRIEQDAVLKNIAINNIKKHPAKFLTNWISNIGRILLNSPYSYNLQKSRSLFYTPLNGIIIVLLLFSLIPTYKNWSKINFAIRFLIFFSFIYLGGSTLGAAESRMFQITAPVLLLWISYILQNTIKINLKFNPRLPNTHEND